MVMSHEVARHVRYNSKLKALQRTPHHMIISRVRTLLHQLHNEPPLPDGGASRPADDQVSACPLKCTLLVPYNTCTSCTLKVCNGRTYQPVYTV